MSENGGRWALILGASSGFGGATAVALARAGYDIAGVHLDRRSTLPQAEEVMRQVREAGRQARFWNVNAADAEKRREVIAALREDIGQSDTPGGVGVLLHSLAFGTLRPFIGPEKESVSQAQLDMTLDVMANSLVYWTQDLMRANLLGNGSQIFAMTSAGSTRVIPTYGAVSAAKAALESHVRQLAFELAPHGISVNAIRAGVTDTAALQRIPVRDLLLAEALKRNPSGRLTQPEDVAKVIATLAITGTRWVTGNVIGVDGGEDITG